MQTYLISSNFKTTANHLDNISLGRQRHECIDIFIAITNKDYNWQDNPTVNMWRGHEYALLTYTLEMCKEWERRGRRDYCRVKISKLFTKWAKGKTLGSEYFKMPEWVYDDELHDSHKSSLMRVNHTFYRKFCWLVKLDIPMKFINDNSYK